MVALAPADKTTHPRAKTGAISDRLTIAARSGRIAAHRVAELWPA
jgi:hypothetical protein